MDKDGLRTLDHLKDLLDKTLQELCRLPIAPGIERAIEFIDRCFVPLGDLREREKEFLITPTEYSQLRDEEE